MSREIRMVPPDWQHPMDEDRGRFKPLFTGYSDAVKSWKEGYAAWERGERSEFAAKHPEDYPEWFDCEGAPPMREDYMPEFAPGTATHMMMYETCSAGTPISPAFATPEELARWLADNNASAFGSMTATYEQWLATCKSGWAPSAISSPATGFISGVAAIEALK